ncbi:single-stranded DNA-binding protein [Nonomuraea jiangxiensis]|uniref:Single-stranded DNA-binding protein n=1 Tax=Nonomuraea jiangxiensis TaxID=633440 RepID=A0A1G9FVH6_9ACTN|nr:single-stranded DNA-binding protein [Nonomuraea jiangxiensis]SDK92404.1 Single-stranded DNA-binding protein [Nonomuraea jiangxiensis]
MNDIYITLTGNVAAEPRQYSFDDGTRVTSLKVLTAHRYFDRKTGQWTDGDKVCFTVRCWRALGENVASSVRAGHPVVVSGKLRIREFGPEGDRRFMPEVEASAVGHDLRWGSGVFTKPERGGGVGLVSKEMRERLDEETRDWAMGSRNLRSLTHADLTSTDAFASTEGDPARAQGTEAATSRALDEQNGTVRALGDGDPMRSLLPDGDTVRILGAEEAPSDGDDEQDRNPGRIALEERAAA